MDIFIKWNDEKNTLQLPILPENYTVDGKQQNTSVNIDATGELNLKGKRALYTVSWSSFFPSEWLPISHASFEEPIKLVRQFEQLMNDNTTIHLVIGTKVNIYATIESFKWSEGRSGDIEYEISIKEYRAVGQVQRVSRIYDDYSISVKWKKKDSWKKLNGKYLNDKTKATADKMRKLPDNAATIKAAKKAWKANNKGKKKKTVKEEVALVGYWVTIKK